MTYHPIKLMADVLGGLGGFGFVLAIKRVVFGPPIETVDLLVPVFISGVLMGCAIVLAHIADRHR